MLLRLQGTGPYSSTCQMPKADLLLERSKGAWCAIVEGLADQNGDTLLIVQAVYGRYHIGALVDLSRAYTIRYVKSKGRWVNVERF